MAAAEISRAAPTLGIWHGLARDPADVQTGIHDILRAVTTGIAAARFTLEACRRRLVRRVGRCIPRRLTADERADRDAIREHVQQRLIYLSAQREMERRWWKTSQHECRIIGKLMSQKLGQLGLDYIFKLDGQKARKLVKFASVEITRDQYIFEVDSRRLPRGVTEIAITQNDVIVGLECTLRKHVSYRLDTEGLFLMVERESGLSNIPRYVQFEDCINAVTSSDGPLVIPIGQSHNRKTVKIDLQHDTTAHFLIGGTTGAGKTNAIHTMISTLAQRNPIEVRLMLIDLKGYEFTIYKDLPHLERPIVTEPEDVLSMIHAVWGECQRRKKILQDETTVSNIKAYNARREPARRLPYIVVFFDELASVMLDKTLEHKELIESYLARIAGLSRAVGIHLVLATQRPSKQVLTGLIKANFPGRIGLACSSVVDSMTIIDNGDSCFHEMVPPGRANLCYGRHHMQFQIAFLSDGKRAEIVADACAGKFGVKRMYHDVTIQDMALFAVREWEGQFKQYDLMRQFGDRGVSRLDIRTMQQRYSHEPFEIDGQLFILEQDHKRGGYWITPYLEHEADETSDVSSGGQWPVAGSLQKQESINPLDPPKPSEPLDPLAPLRKQAEINKSKKDRMLEKAYVFLLDNPMATTGDLSKRLGISRPTAKRYIAQLQDAHRIRRSPNGWMAVQVVDAQPGAEDDSEFDEFRERVSSLIGGDDDGETEKEIVNG